MLNKPPIVQGGSERGTDREKEKMPDLHLQMTTFFLIEFAKVPSQSSLDINSKTALRT